MKDCGNTRLCFKQGRWHLIAASSVKLAPLEAALADFLFSNDRVVGKRELMDNIYRDGDPPFEKAIDALLHRLRKKLVKVGSDAVIDTRFGIGWHLHETGMPSKGGA